MMSLVVSSYKVFIMKKALFNANLVLFDRIMYNAGIEITDGIISKIFSDCDYDENCHAIDCEGNYLSPGFIDIHVHGGGGSDFCDGTEDAVEKAIRTHAEYGTTSFLPTTLSLAQNQLITSLQMIEKVQKKRTVGNPRIFGSHMEGNFFSLQMKGAQDTKYFFPPTKENYMPLLSCVDNIKMISCAPELENGLEFAREMVKKGIIMSVAHSDATYEEYIRAIECGYNHVTHIYNGNSLIHDFKYYCKIGICEAALMFGNVFVEVIADGKHLPKELLRMIYQVKGADMMNLCTDAMGAVGMPEGTIFRLGELEAIVEDGVASLLDRSTFASSVCTSNRAVRTMYKDAGIPLYDAVKMMTATPARILGEFGDIGSITVGKVADINVFDEELNIKYTLIDGEEYNNNF